MRVQVSFTAFALAAMCAALAADTVMRPGRWEVTAQMDFGGRQLPPGMPLTKPMTSIACITADDVKKTQSPVPLPDGCRMSDYSNSGKEIRFTAHCEEATIKYRLTLHSPDSYSGITTSHGKDASQTMTMKLSGQRTGDACSASELAEYLQD